MGTRTTLYIPAGRGPAPAGHSRDVIGILVPHVNLVLLYFCSALPLILLAQHLGFDLADQVSVTLGILLAIPFPIMLRYPVFRRPWTLLPSATLFIVIAVIFWLFRPQQWAFEGLENGARVPQDVLLRVNYPAKVPGDVIVIQQQHKNGKYFPMPVALNTQTCTATLALTGGKPFSGKIGEANQNGERFTLHLVVADTMASDTLTQTLQRWCNDESYPGMSELPHGVKIKHSVEVQRFSDP